MLLGDLGADVIKVELPSVGDDTRSWGPPWLKDQNGSKESAYFVSVNRNKRSVAVNMKTSQGQEIVTKV